MMQPMAGEGPSHAARPVQDTYDRPSLRNTAVNPSTVATTLRYDNVYRLTEETKRDSGGAVVYTHIYTYDEVGNRTSRNDGGTRSLGHFYDANNKLTSTRWVGGGQPPGPITANFYYDGAGNMTSVTGTEFGSKTLVYDDENRLTSITYGGVTDTYTYNWQGLRTRAVLNGTTYRYLYNGERVLQELTDAGAVNATYTTEDDSYYGTLLHLKRATGESRFPLYDEIGSARGLVDASGTVTDTYDMDTFGTARGTTGSTPNPYRYGAAWGYITDPSGFLQLGARYYWPEVGRFVSQDPIGDAENAYAYAGDEPLDSIDPEGLHETSSWWHNLRHWQTWREGFLGGWRGGYYSCYAKCATIGLAKHGAAEKAAPHVARGYARWAWHHKYPRWFRAWGKYSKVHVPATAGKLAKGLGAASLAYLDYELFRCIAECAECVRFGR